MQNNLLLLPLLSSSLPHSSLCSLQVHSQLVRPGRHTSLSVLSLIMSSLTFLSVYLSGVSLIVLLMTADHPDAREDPDVDDGETIQCFPPEASEYDDFTPAPDYNSDYNATFEYSFYSNTSLEDLDEFSERFSDQEEGDVTITMVTTQGPAMDGGADGHNGASLPVCLETRMLLWTLMILIEQLLQHTL